MFSKEKIKKNKYFLIVFFLFLLSFLLLAFYLFLRKNYQPINEAPIEEEVNQPVVSLPDSPAQDSEKDFKTTITEIRTLNNLIDYLNTKFVFQEREDKNIRFPEEFFELKQGSELDFALFSAYLLKSNNLGEVAIMRYKYLDEREQQGINTVVIFRGTDLPPKHIAFGAKGTQIFIYGRSFEELFRAEEQRLELIITGYEIFLLWPLPEVEALWPEEWRQR